MASEWQTEKGTGWIDLPAFGSINPRRDDVGGGRQYFTPKVDDGTFARVTGKSISGGPETFYFEFDEPFLLADFADRCIEVEISLLVGGVYAVKYRDAKWPDCSSGGW